MEIDALWPGGPRFYRSGDVFKIGTDAVLLASFCGVSGVRRALDLGCGSGIIAALLAWNTPALSVEALEIVPEAARLARENIRLCGLEGRVSVTEGDLRAHRALYPAGHFDLVVSNPPYYAGGRGKVPADVASITARMEAHCTLADICAAAAYLTKWGGRFALVHKPERMAEVICALSAAGLEPKRLRLVQHRAGAAPSLFLLETRRGGRPSLTIEPPLIMTDEHGDDSPEIQEIYHRRAE